MESDQCSRQIKASLPFPNKCLNSLTGFRNSEFSGHHAIDPLMEMEYNTFVDSSFYSVISGELWNKENGNIENEISSEFVLIENEGKKKLSLYDNKIYEEEIIMGNDHQEIILMEKEKDKCLEIREEINNNSSSMLSRDAISKYFYIPIIQASKELHIGLTHLKKRCRNLGIRRWPCRKLMSLQTIINNVKVYVSTQLNKLVSIMILINNIHLKELENGVGNEMKEKLKDMINVLEKEKKKIEEIPDMEIEEKTKQLRQICNMKNHKKRRLMSSMPHQLHPFFDTYCTTSTPHNVEEDDEEIMSLLANYSYYDTLTL
nr:protein RKD3-like isoform X2 [Solanum lycopersicum]